MRIISDPSTVPALMRTHDSRERLSTSFGTYECMCCKQRPAQGVYLCTWSQGADFMLICAFCGMSNRPYSKWNGFYSKRLVDMIQVMAITRRFSHAGE